MRELKQGTLWGLATVAAVMVAIYAGSTETGRKRLGFASTRHSQTVPPSRTEGAAPLDTQEGRQLAESVRALADDRARLVARLAAVERRMEDVNGSMARMRAGTWAAIPLPDFAAAAPQAKLAAAAQEDDDTTASIAAPDSPPKTAPGTSGLKSEYGLDLGNGTSVDALRNAWRALVGQHGTLLEGLYPVVYLRERPSHGSVELHLIAGPLPNAATAARLCAVMTTAGSICQPAAFEGQRLAVQ